MSFPFLAHVDIPNWIDECTHEFYKALDRYDYESILAFKEAHAQHPDFIASIRDTKGNTPLHIAAESLRKTTEIIPPIHKAVIHLLRSVGCSENTPNSEGITPMYIIDSLDAEKRAIFDDFWPVVVIQPMDNENDSNAQSLRCTHSDPIMSVKSTCALPNQELVQRHSEPSSSSSQPISQSQPLPISQSQPIPQLISQPLSVPQLQPLPIPTISSDLSHSGLPTQSTLTDTISHIQHTPSSPSSPPSPSPPLPPPPPPSPPPSPPSPPPSSPSPIKSGNPEIANIKEDGCEKEVETRETSSEVEGYTKREIDLETSITNLRDEFTEEGYITAFINEVR